MKSGLTLAIPCRADEPGLSATLESLFVACQHAQLPSRLLSDLVICINGLKPGETCTPLTAVHDFCARHGLPVTEVWLEPNERSATCGVQVSVPSSFAREACPERSCRSQDERETEPQHESISPHSVPLPQGEGETVFKR